MNRPQKFVDLGYYDSIEILLSHSDDWIKNIKFKRGKGRVTRQRWRLLDLEDLDVDQAIKESLNTAGNLPFDPNIHEYIGLKNRHQRVVNKEFYESIVKTFNGNVKEYQGYIEFHKLGKLHNLALGRIVGDHKNDKLQGCHGKGGLLDNRVTKKADGTLDRRTLTLGSASTNASHIIRKKVGSHSRYPGVYQPKNSNKWISQWMFESNNYNLGTYTLEIDAANAYAYVQENREDIAGLLTPIPKAATKVQKKTIRAANLTIVKSYIKTSLHSTVQVIRDTPLVVAVAGEVEEDVEEEEDDDEEEGELDSD